MGEMLGVVCGTCNEEFTAHIGAGMRAVATRCNACGAESSEPHAFLDAGQDGANHIAERCECGGTFSADAPYRCPNCSATYSEEELRDLEPTIVGLWD
jgi:hypothetical protein